MARRLYEREAGFTLRAGASPNRATRLIHMVSDVPLTRETAIDDMLATPLPGSGVDAGDCIDGATLAVDTPWPATSPTTIPSNFLTVSDYDVQSIAGNPYELFILVIYDTPFTPGFSGSGYVATITFNSQRRFIYIPTYRRVQAAGGGGTDVYERGNDFIMRRPGHRVRVASTVGALGQPNGPNFEAIFDTVGKFYTLQNVNPTFGSRLYYKQDSRIEPITGTTNLRVISEFYTEPGSLAFYPGGASGQALGYVQIPAIPAFGTAIATMTFTTPSYVVALDNDFSVNGGAFTP